MSKSFDKIVKIEEADARLSNICAVKDALYSNFPFAFLLCLRTDSAVLPCHCLAIFAAWQSTPSTMKNQICKATCKWTT